MPKRTRDYHSWLIKRLSDRHEAERYLKVAMADSEEMFLKALRNVAEANKMAKVAEDAGVNRESLYRTLSEEGNPRYYTLFSILDALGIALEPKLKQSVASSPEPAPRVAENTIQTTIYGTGNIFETSSTWTASGLSTTINATPTVTISISPCSIPFYLLGEDKTSDGLARVIN
jgi:probable addiction module antidote protein